MASLRPSRYILVAVLVLALLIVICMSIPVPGENHTTDAAQYKCKRREFYHNETQQCYKERTKGPCNGKMMFQKFDSIFGGCDCSEDEIVPWIYNPEKHDCYPAYEQSYCLPGEWVIFDDNLKPICAHNSCATSKLEGETTVLFKNECVTLNKPSKLCGSLEEVGIKSINVIPECIPTIAEQSVLGTSQLKCRPGTRRDMNGQCRRSIVISE